MDVRPARPEDGHPDPQVQPAVGRVGRALSLLVGTALVGAGSVSVFISNNGGGSLGLLVGGIFLLIIGMTGDAPTRIKIGDKELVLRELNEVRGKVQELNDKVAELFLVTMAPSMYENLGKLASGRFGHYRMSSGLTRELLHLRDIGYIENLYFDKIPKEGQDLSDHVKVTDAGRDFLKLRQESLSPY
jgi:hypothetical protein